MGGYMDVKKSFDKFDKLNRRNKIDNVIVVGASTGGKDTLLRLIKKIPVEFSPILIVQHMPPGQSGSYVKYMKKNSGHNVIEAEDGLIVENNQIVVANSEFQMRLKVKNGNICLSLKDEGYYRGFCPSIDLFFSSAAEILKNNCIGVILTGCSDDGSQGILDIKNNGGYTICQDENSSIVYTMPKNAKLKGGIIEEMDLRDMPKRLIELSGYVNNKVNRYAFAE